jgi:hypothetical protein
VKLILDNILKKLLERKTPKILKSLVTIFLSLPWDPWAGLRTRKNHPTQILSFEIYFIKWVSHREIDIEKRDKTLLNNVERIRKQKLENEQNCMKLNDEKYELQKQTSIVEEKKIHYEQMKKDLENEYSKTKLQW